MNTLADERQSKGGDVNYNTVCKWHVLCVNVCIYDRVRTLFLND